MEFRICKPIFRRIEFEILYSRIPDYKSGTAAPVNLQFTGIELRIYNPIFSTIELEILNSRIPDYKSGTAASVNL